MDLRTEIFAKLVERAAPLFGKTIGEMREDMNFTEDLQAKSVHFSQMTTYLEDEYDIEIPYMPFRRKATIGEAVDYVLELVEEEE